MPKMFFGVLECSSLVCGLGNNVGNFWAKYTYGNKSKGIINIHFNIRSLKYKIVEVKRIISAEKPHIFGLSECEIKRENTDLDSLKISGYTMLLPRSWEMHGFARVVTYVKNSFKYEQIFDLEDELVQSIWIKGTFANSKGIFFCHAYREHTCSLGSSISIQKEYLSKFLNQWESATWFGNTSEPNEVHISLDMNLDYSPSKWLQQSYDKYSLTKMVQNLCNACNFTQLIKEPTRLSYNSVRGVTELSCIDHVYCNYQHRCSTPRVIENGASDHDIILYMRDFKVLSSPSKTIRKRSFRILMRLSL